MKQENRAYTDIINQSFESYLVDVDFADFEKTFGKEEAEKVLADYKKTYDTRLIETTKYLSNNIYQSWIDDIDNYIAETPPSKLAKPCIIGIGYMFGADSITGSMFLDDPSTGMQYITINPAYINKNNPTAPQFVVVETKINALSSISQAGKKLFEQNLDLKKLEAFLLQ